MEYLEYCPWTLHTEKASQLTLHVVNFGRIIVDVAIVFLTFLLTVGYSLSKLDLTLFEIKTVFGLTSAKFMLM